MTAFAFGDVHGYLDPFAARLEEAGLVDGGLRWTGGAATLWLTGDLADRGPLGAKAVEAVMRLEQEADEAGGAVRCLLGNHDLLLLAVARFGDYESRSPRRSIRADWLANGGREHDLDGLTDEHLVWLARRPALGRQDSTLLAHCDSTIYAELGESVEAVNDRVAATLAGDDVSEWAALDDLLWRRNELWDPAEARRFVEAFGCERVAHGHTPIPVVTGDDPAEVTEPLVYADGRCVNVDGGLYLGGAGFVWEVR